MHEKAERDLAWSGHHQPHHPDIGYSWRASGSVVKGRGLYGAALVVLMGMLMVSRKNNREKRLSRLYGGFHFHMPDGEIVPVSFDQVKSEYVHGQQSKYAGRKVTRASRGGIWIWMATAIPALAC